MKYKRFLYGSGSLILIAIVAAALVLLNVVTEKVVNQFPALRIDLTENKLFEMSEQTKGILGALEADIDVYFFYSSSPDTLVENTLNTYAAYSNRLHVKHVTPSKDPQLIEKYNTVTKPLSNNSVVFARGDNYIVVTAEEMFPLNTYTNQRDFMSAEARFTTAILTVLRDARSSVVLLTNHNEEVGPAYRALIEQQNMSVTDIDLATAAIPEDADVVISVAPQVDFTSDEIDKLDAFLNQGKAFHIYLDPGTVEMTVLNAYLREWGMTFESNVLLESDPNYVFSQMPYNIISQLYSEHEVNKPLINAKVRVLTSFTRGVDLSFTGKAGASAMPMLTTTSKAYAKGVPAESLAREAGDKAGTMTIAASAYKLIGNNSSDYKNALIVACGTSSVVNDSLLNYNRDFVTNTLTWSTSQYVPLDIIPKTLTAGRLNAETLTASVAGTIYIVLLIVMPLLCLVFGVVVWYRRRHL